MTVLEGIQRSAEFLARKGVDSPRLQAELLLAHVLQQPRVQLYLNFERALGAAELETFRELVRRRGQREPLQQITGTACFCGLEIAVNREVLVPRAETELLAERGWEFLRRLARGVGEGGAPVASPTALDIGTGSGCLAIALAVNCPGARVYGVDVSEAALAVASRNAARHGLAERLQFLPGDGFGGLPDGLRFHLLVSNPPYIPSAEIAQLQAEVRDHEPRLALDGGADGLDYYRRLAASGARRLRPGGRLMVEIGDGQAERLRELFELQKWIVEAVDKDYSGTPRILVLYRAE